MRYLAFGLALGLSACSSNPAGPGDGALEFSSRALPLGQHESALQVTGETGSIAVNATISAPDPCGTPTATLQQEGPALTLRVLVNPSTTVCAAVIGHLEYEAVIRGLSRGTYDLEVVHHYPSTGWPAATASHKVQVQ